MTDETGATPADTEQTGAVNQASAAGQAGTGRQADAEPADTDAGIDRTAAASGSTDPTDSTDSTSDGVDRITTAKPERESLTQILGGRRGAIDASIPPFAFVVGWLATGRSISWGAIVAIGVAVVLGGYRLLRGDKARAVVVSLAAVVIAALIALHTGRAEDFFLLQLLSNAASALLFAASVVVRWPLLGVIVGLLLGQKTRWRRDPALLRAYSWASWVWVLQYLLRVVVYGLLWWAGQVVALGVARTVLSWPLVAATVAVSGWVLYKALPDDHPGLRPARAEPPGT
ncbi:hypothetical protein BJY18_005395 [Amycolatopsis jiangsuensis]|uniref:Intracellular septation protein A n=1 Tax=Amycolatopsis jiangsuensis TaxID=1181879 RepID=A0A840J1G6_9PSEU|nr:hypothetical protein [Amycolatopsis jiangsuensis]